jgi:hypothetical protein
MPTLISAVIGQRASKPKAGRAYFSEPLQDHLAVVSLPHMLPNLFVGMSILVENRQGLEGFGLKLIAPSGEIVKELNSAFINPDSWNGDQFTEVLPLFPTTFSEFGEHRFEVFINGEHVHTIPLVIAQGEM